MIKKICNAYLDALNEGNLENVLALFDANATVDSPLYGSMPAVKFYTELFADTNQSDTRLLNIFSTVEAPSAIALHFQYDWTLKNGKIVAFECVDVFDLDPETEKFTRLKIIYDTAPLRGDFYKSTGAGD